MNKPINTEPVRVSAVWNWGDLVCDSAHTCGDEVSLYNAHLTVGDLYEAMDDPSKAQAIIGQILTGYVEEMQEIDHA